MFTKPNRFVNLHSHTNFSTFDGLGYPADHINFVISEKQGMNAWALTDHGNGNGLAHANAHAEALKKKGIDYKQLYGVEFYFVPSLKEWQHDMQSHKDAINDAKTSEQKEKIAKSKTDIDADDDVESGGFVVEDEEETKTINVFQDEWKRRYHLIVIAKNQQGLKNLFTLVKKSYKYGFYRYPRIDFEMLKEHGEGLHVSTACIHPDAYITTDNGDIKMIDLVKDFISGKDINALSYNELTKELEYKKVTWANKTRKNAKLLQIKDAKGNVLKLTPDHKVYVKGKNFKGWIEARNISVGDKVISIK